MKARFGIIGETGFNNLRGSEVTGSLSAYAPFGKKSNDSVSGRGRDLSNMVLEKRS